MTEFGKKIRKERSLIELKLASKSIRLMASGAAFSFVISILAGVITSVAVSTDFSQLIEFLKYLLSSE